MFEKEAEEYAKQWIVEEDVNALMQEAFQDGAEFGYNKANEDVKHDLMMKLKDEGIVKVLKDSIFCNKKLSSQEQQELCAWVECAIDFGENLDECAKELEEANKANEWHYTKYELPPEDVPLICMRGGNIYVAWFILGKWKGDKYNDVKKPYAWKEIVLPKESE